MCYWDKCRCLIYNWKLVHDIFKSSWQYKYNDN